MRTPSILPTRRSRHGITALFTALAFLLPSAAQLGAQATATKPATGAAAKPAVVQPAKPATTQPPVVKRSATTAAKNAPAAKTLVDINHATVKELKTIPGIGDAYAAKIVAGRPYANKSQLVSKKVIAASLYETIQGMVIAKQ